MSITFKKKSFFLTVKNILDQEYIYQIKSLPQEIALKKQNKATVHNGQIIIELFKKKENMWKEFGEGTYKNMSEMDLEVRSSKSDIQDDFFEEIDDEELQREMNKLLYLSMQG